VEIHAYVDDIGTDPITDYQNQNKLLKLMKTNLRHLLTLMATLVASHAFAASPPTIVCPVDQVLECTSARGATGVVNVTVQDVDGDALYVLWGINGDFARTNFIAAGGTTDPIALSLTNRFRPGTNEVIVGVTDDGANIVMCSSTVLVQDSTPPTIRSIATTPNILWPPNHKLRPVRVVVRAWDACGPVSWRITDITSNELEDGLGDGSTSPDWVICGPHKALLRAERSGEGTGRVYTLNIEVSDRSQNTTNATVQVVVPHDRGRGKIWCEQEQKEVPPGHIHGNSGKANPGRGHGNGNGKGQGH